MGYQSIGRFLNRWLPATFNELPDTKMEIKIRARALVGLYLSSVIVIVVSFFIFLAIQLFGNHDFSLALASLIVAGLILFFQVLMFYKLGNIGASAIIFSMTFFGGVLAILVLTGGWTSPVRQLFFCAPIISFLVGGRHEGVYISLLVLITGLIMLVAYRMNFQLFQIIKSENVDLVAAIIWIISINILIACLSVYDAILEDYSKLMRRSR